MKSIADWLIEECGKLEYGTIEIIITKHQGEIVAIEKVVREKQKLKKKS
ncbi:MAG: hypothetical protein DRP09_12650 [Candidatus Thorarchaeota archaeon]|nr:MAG: hypothetical protein DRP09_12650 [Candidatus Thorarchaeota archaeon]